MGVSTFMGHSRDIRGVFVAYTYVSGMCRVCIGKVSKWTGRVGGGFDNLVERGRSSCSLRSRNLINLGPSKPPFEGG